MKQYLDRLKHIMDNGTVRHDRTGVGTKSVFGYQMRFDLSQGFPLVTTKKCHTRSIFYELLWFLKGDTNIRYLHDHTVEQGYKKEDFRIYAGTGMEDIAYPNLTPQIEAMKKYTDLFEFSERLEEGNLHYTLMENAPHMYEKVYQHIYHYMPVLFPEKA